MPFETVCTADGPNAPAVPAPSGTNSGPTLKGTRIAVQTILEFLYAGDTIEDILANYPTLTRDDILACLAYSARLL